MSDRARRLAGLALLFLVLIFASWVYSAFVVRDQGPAKFTPTPLPEGGSGR